MMRLAASLAFLASLAMALTPNEKLKKCCGTISGDDIDKGCLQRFCDFKSITQTNVLNFLDKCSDKGGTVGQMWDCASLRHDHTECCKRAGVEGKCLAYCAASKGVPTNYLDYVFCTESFNEIKTCFEEHLDKHDAYDHKNKH